LKISSAGGKHAKIKCPNLGWRKSKRNQLNDKFHFLSKKEGEFFAALCDALVPEGEDPSKDPGALTVGGLDYIDSMLYDSSEQRQHYFQDAILILEKESKSRFARDFRELNAEERKVVIRDGFLNPKFRERMFDLRSLVLESFYSDYHSPDYSGITGWKYVGFGGRRISDVKKDWSFLKVWQQKD
jgi:Gluconate 2-dehydrogenase subunit 3